MIVLVAGNPRAAAIGSYSVLRNPPPSSAATDRTTSSRSSSLPGWSALQPRSRHAARRLPNSPRSPSHSGRRRTLGRRLRRWARQGDVPNASPLALGRTTSPRPRQDPRAPRPDLTSPIRHPEAQLEDLLVALNVDRVGRFDRAPPFQLEAIAGCTPSGRTMPSRYPSLGS
jgi:hypothetical protein